MRFVPNIIKNTGVVIFFFFIISIVLISSCTGKKNSPITSLMVIDSIKHYYPIRHKKELKIPYHIVNTGTEPLFINHIESSGACITITDYPKLQIPAGRQATIFLLYKSEGLFGYNKHFITFDANTIPSRHTLIFDVVVVADEFGYGDGFDYRYEPEVNDKSALKEAVNGDETEQAYYTDSSRGILKGEEKLGTGIK